MCDATLFFFFSTTWSFAFIHTIATVMHQAQDTVV